MHPPSRLQPPGHAALRHGRRSIPGQAYLVTTVTTSRERWFANARIATAVARQLGARRLWRDNRIHAWVLMPDHMHLLFTLGDDESLAHLMARIKSVSSRAAQTAATRTRPLWAATFHDRALRADEQIARAAHYVIANPVRAGIADTVWDWPFWDTEWLPEPGADELYIPRTLRP